MPALSRNCAKLLHRVGNQTHATQEDHHLEEHESQDEHAISPRRHLQRQTQKRQQQEQQPTPPSSDRRSSLQRSAVERMKFTEETASIPEGRKRKQRKEKEEEEEDHMREPESEGSSSDETEQQQRYTKPAAGRKGRKVDVSTSRVQTDDEDGVPSWLTQQKPGRKFQSAKYTTAFNNVHAAPPKFRKPTTTYSKKVQPEKPRLKAAKQRAPRIEEEEELPKREFSKARVYQRGLTGDSKEARVFAQPRTTPSMPEDGSTSPLSSSLSSLDSDPIQDADPRNLESDDVVVECAICGETVDILLRQSFEDEFTPGRSMSYKWQQRFCRYHKQDRARKAWQERGYPEINWDGLESRLRRYHSHLRDVTMGRKPSRHRTKLEGLVKSGKKTILQNLSASDGQRHSSVGYYGPRGEKEMTEHILAHLSEDIRSQAAKDKLVAASGVSGGVSGFVQLVLVPELAEQLLQEDLGLSGDRLIEVMEESAELGELLHPELNEQVNEVASENV